RDLPIEHVAALAVEDVAAGFVVHEAVDVARLAQSARAVGLLHDHDAVAVAGEHARERHPRDAAAEDGDLQASLRTSAPEWRSVIVKRVPKSTAACIERRPSGVRALLFPTRSHRA